LAEKISLNIKYSFSRAEIKNAGEKIGLREEAPFDKILVSAAGEAIPQKLIDQLKVEGRMVIPVQNSVWQIDKFSKSEAEKRSSPVLFLCP